MTQETHNRIAEEICMTYIPDQFNDTLKQHMFGEHTQKLWQVMFTHESFDPNNDSNYEQYEAFGGHIVDTMIVQIVLEAVPIASPELLTRNKNYYMSTKNQAELADSMGLTRNRSSDPSSTYPIISKLITVSVRVKEDIFESFFGLLHRLGDTFRLGTGYILCRALMKSLFKDTDFSVMPQAEDVEYVKIWFDRNGLSKPVIRTQSIVRNGKTMIKADYYIADEQQAFEIGFESSHIAMGIGNSISDARRDAASNLERLIKENNLDTNTSLKDSTLEYKSEAENKIKQSGYSDMEVKNYIDGRFRLFQLIAKNNTTGRREVLREVLVDNDKVRVGDVKVKLFMNYLGVKKPKRTTNKRSQPRVSQHQKTPTNTPQTRKQQTSVYQTYQTPTQQSNVGYQAPQMITPQNSSTPTQQSNVGYQAPQTYQTPTQQSNVGYQAPQMITPQTYQTPTQQSNVGYQAPQMITPQNSSTPTQQLYNQSNLMQQQLYNPMMQ
jgi:dsRNA-specific ribonuclease